MNIFEITTTNQTLEPKVFREFANIFFQLNNLSADFSVEASTAMLEVADQAADNLRIYTDDELYTRMITLGSIFGEALCVVKNGNWVFEPKDKRWMVIYETSNKTNIKANVFNKLKKYIENGDDDSLNYFFSALP